MRLHAACRGSPTVSERIFSNPLLLKPLACVCVRFKIANLSFGVFFFSFTQKVRVRVRAGQQMKKGDIESIPAERADGSLNITAEIFPVQRITLKVLGNKINK